MRKVYLLGGLLITLLGPAQAQVAPTPTDTAAPANPLTYYGFVDAYYGYDFDHAASNQRPALLYSHNRQNEFAINNLVLGARYDNGQVRGALALHTGTYVSANYAAEDATLRHIYEGWAGFRPFRKAWLDAGIFASHIGLESALSKDNWTLTRSLDTENTPYYETGVRFTYEASPKLTLTGLVLNGWQNIRENNQGKALGTQLQWRPTPKLLLNSSTFYGNEQPQDSLKRRRYFHDFYLTYAATERLSLALVFDIGTQQSQGHHGYDPWHASTLLARLQLNKQFATTLRGEYFDAAHGVLINSISPSRADARLVAGGTSLGFDYAPHTHMLVRLEGRYLRAQTPLFEHSNGFSRNYGNLTSSVAFWF